MNTKLLAFLGLVIFASLVIGSIALGRSGLVFVRIPSAVFVVGVAGALGLASYKGGGIVAYIACCKRFCIPAGITGTLIGVVQMLQNISDYAQIGAYLGVAFLGVFYGVICYCIADAIVTKAAD